MTTAHAHDQTEWLKSQQQYWQDLMQTQQTQWAELMGSWQNGVPGTDGFSKFFSGGGTQFLDMMQSLGGAAGGNNTAEAALQDWAAKLQEFFSGIVQPQDPMDSYKNMFTLNEHMVKAGHAWASAFSDQRTYGHGPKGFQHFDPLGFFATMPGIGYTREKQEEWSKLYRLYSEHENVKRRYNNSMASVGLEATQRFQAYLSNPPEGAEPLTSLKSVYVKWVDICEDVYAVYALTSEYTELYGESVNSLMALKQQSNKLTDSFVEEMNLPTRKEVDVLHQRLHELRREVIALRAATKTKAPAKAKAAATPAPTKPAKAKAVKKAAPKKKVTAAKKGRK